MEVPLNTAAPRVMHIDLNACFAMTEQQANPLLRGRPVGVTNRLGSDWATIIAPSYEAKRLGVRCGTRVDEAKRLAPGIVIIETDPPKYRYVHRVIKRIFEEYAPRVTMKSIDEGVLDFRGTDQLYSPKDLIEIGYKIKTRVKEELGEWMTVNIGLGPNWFLAKLAASLNKPDGLDVIDHHNLEGVYLCGKLTDLNGINKRLRARLIGHGIMNPYEFLHTPERILSKEIFRSIHGRHWYYRLRGYEVDDFEAHLRSAGKQYALQHQTNDQKELEQLIAKLAYYVSRRLNKCSRTAYGLFLGIRYAEEGETLDRWHLRHRFTTPTYDPTELQRRAIMLFRQSPPGQKVAKLTLTSYQLEQPRSTQLSLIDSLPQNQDRINTALQSVNDRYGDLSLFPARILGAAAAVPEKIAFGSTRYLIQ